MKRISLLLLAFSIFLGLSQNADARPPRHDRDRGRHEDRHRHDRHDFGPGHGHPGGAHRHHSKPHFHPILGSYFKSPGYYGRDFYGKRIWHPILGVIYVR